MEIREYLTRIRKLLHDPEGKAWDDEELSSMLAFSVRMYSLDTGAFRGEFAIYADEDGLCKLPDNYAGFLAGWNSRGSHIDPVSTDTLSRHYGKYLSRDGVPEFIAEDLNSIGYARPVPNPHSFQQGARLVPSSPYGIPVAAAYGIPDAQARYGIPVAGLRFTSAGSVKYLRVAGLAEIPDHTALIFHVAHQAYAADGDFQNVERSVMFLTWYKKRVARTGTMKNAPRTLPRKASFY